MTFSFGGRGVGIGEVWSSEEGGSKGTSIISEWATSTSDLSSGRRGEQSMTSDAPSISFCSLLPFPEEVLAIGKEPWTSKEDLNRKRSRAAHTDSRPRDIVPFMIDTDERRSARRLSFKGPGESGVELSSNLEVLG